MTLRQVIANINNPLLQRKGADMHTQQEIMENIRITNSPTRGLLALFHIRS
jgi:hypothetical protein